MKTFKRVTRVVLLLLLAWAVWFAACRTAWYSYLSIAFTVHIERTSDETPIKAVRCRGLFYKDQADRYLDLLPDIERRVDSWTAVADPFDGKPLDIRVIGSSTESMLNVTLTYYHEKYLLVVADLADGRWVRTIAEIPDARTTREMRVTLP